MARAKSPKDAKSKTSEVPAAEDIIDAEAETPVRSSKRAASPAAKSTGKTPFPIQLAGLLVLSLCVAGAVFYFHGQMQEMRARLAQLDARMPALESQNERAAKQAELAADLAALKQKTTQMTRQLAERVAGLEVDMTGHDEARLATQNALSEMETTLSALAEKTDAPPQQTMVSPNMALFVLAQLYAESQLGLDLTAWPTRLDAVAEFSLAYPDQLAALRAGELAARASLWQEGQAMLAQAEAHQGQDAVGGLSGFWQKLGQMVRLQTIETDKHLVDYQGRYERALSAGDGAAMGAILTEASAEFDHLAPQISQLLSRQDARRQTEQHISAWYQAVQDARIGDK